MTICRSAIATHTRTQSVIRHTSA